jgi:HlyD family secretion protein
MEGHSFKLPEVPVCEQTPLVQRLLQIIMEQQRRIEQLEKAIWKLKGEPVKPKLEPSRMEKERTSPEEAEEQGSSKLDPKRRKTQELIEQLEKAIWKLKGEPVKPKLEPSRMEKERTSPEEAEEQGSSKLDPKRRKTQDLKIHHHTEVVKAHQDTDIVRTLGFDDVNRDRKPLKRWGIIAILGVLAVGVGIVVKNQVLNARPSEFKTVKVQRGSLTVTVTATGTLKPINQVDVGSELSGTIETVEVDYNDRVKRGQILAMLNTDELKAKLLQSKSSLESEQARLQVAKATLVETRLKFQRMQELTAKGLAPTQDLDTAKAAYLRAQAEEASAKAQIALTRATLDANQTNLDKAAIHSPIDGIVLARKVEPGQTVAASFQTPVLFTLAENLTRMVLHANIDEANMGQTKKGQDATFTVDAYPNRKFPAKIMSIRNTPQTVEGIVTYETLLSVDNSELLLRPGMTATVDITTHMVEDAILVPNNALRFTPPWTNETTAPDAALSTDRKQLVWTLHDGRPVPIPVTVGLSDGHNTEILAEDLKPGLPLLVEVVREDKAEGSPTGRLPQRDN